MKSNRLISLTEELSKELNADSAAVISNRKEHVRQKDYHIQSMKERAPRRLMLGAKLAFCTTICSKAYGG